MTVSPFRIGWLAVLTVLAIAVVLSACSDSPAPTPEQTATPTAKSTVEPTATATPPPARETIPTPASGPTQGPAATATRPPCPRRAHGDASHDTYTHAYTTPTAHLRRTNLDTYTHANTIPDTHTHANAASTPTPAPTPSPTPTLTRTRLCSRFFPASCAIQAAIHSRQHQPRHPHLRHHQHPLRGSSASTRPSDRRDIGVRLRHRVAGQLDARRGQGCTAAPLLPGPRSQ